MKIPHKPFSRRYGALAVGRDERGMATIIFVALLAIMMILIMASATPLVQLRIEEKLIEQKQIERLNASQTNAVAATVSPAKPELK